MKSRPAQLLIRVGYDGSRFHGVQPQPGLPTAGDALLQRVRDAFGDVTIHAISFAARTDAGVHADANLASCRVTQGPDATAQLQAAIAAMSAPRDDGLLSVQAFHHPCRTFARAIATDKHYRYVIETQCNTPNESQKHGAWQIAPVLDIERMHTAARALIGTHDFSSYAHRKAAGSRVKTVHDIRIEQADNRVIIDVHGAGFLRYMVRYIVGHLAAIGAGLEAPERAPERRDARVLPPQALRAPADGLRLMNVNY